MDNQPQIGLPIDDASGDLREWAKTLKYPVNLWEIKKYVDFNDKSSIVYEFPEEFKPVLDTEEENVTDEQCGEITRYEVSIGDLIESGLIKIEEKIFMEYTPRNGSKMCYTADILEDGAIKVLDQVYSSPSYAALACIQDAGSHRKTVNGWTSWKTEDGKSLADIRELFLNRV